MSHPKCLRYVAAFILTLLGLTGLPGMGWTAPSLSLGSSSGLAGSSVTLQMNFDPTSASVAGMQFNLVLPAGLSTGTVTAGTLLTAISKSVSTYFVGNTWTFIVYGLNQTSIPLGSLFTAQVRIAPSLSTGTLSLPLSSVVYTDPSGQPVTPGTASAGSVIVLPSAPVITSAGTSSATVNAAYSYQIMATNSPTSYAAVGLPANVTLNATTGVISGTPTVVGISTITLSAINSGGTGTKTLVLTVNPPAPIITSGANATGTTGVPFSYPVTASNNPTSYSAVGLPPGLTMSSLTGVISGTPSQAGSFNVTVQATNVSGTGSKIMTLVINSACDIDLDGSIVVPDVQLMVNQSLGSSACTTDLNKDGRCDVIDIQRVVNAVLGGACVTP